MNHPIRVEWIQDTTAADRLGVTIEEIIELVRNGELEGQLSRNINPVQAKHHQRHFVWFVRASEVEAERLRRLPARIIALDEPEEEWDTNGYRLAAPEPCVLYGLLTAADVTELERRRAKLMASQTAVIPMPEILAALAAAV